MERDRAERTADARVWGVELKIWGLGLRDKGYMGMGR